MLVECGARARVSRRYPDFAEWLVEKEIDSFSLNPDAAIKTATTDCENRTVASGVERARRPSLLARR